MWDAIQSNKRRSRWLIAILGAVLVSLGVAIGMAVDVNAGGPIGAAIALGVWLILWLLAVAQGDAIVLSSAGARQIEKADAPQLWNIVEEMTIASGLGTMPRVYIIDDESPNAFAAGRNPEKAAVAVTSGLLKRLNRDELQGVIAHEMAHVKNLDVKFMTLAAVMIGSIVLIAEVFLRSLWYGGGRRRSSSSSGGGQAEAVMMIVAVIFAILAPLFAQMLYFACSRRREYLADACAARFTRYPEGLASALEKISRHAAAKQQVSRTLAPLYIVNPLQSRKAFTLFSTHPPVDERIAILRRMSGGADFATYEAAYKKLHDGGDCIDRRSLDEDTSVQIRPPTVEPQGAEVDRARASLDLVDRLAGFAILPCACGMRMKLPPGLQRDSVNCPRCGASLALAAALPAAAFAAGDSGAPPPPMRYRRHSEGWESFQCGCGRAVQLSPGFAAAHVSCRACGRHIAIEPAQGPE